jgi:quercetin dioxygenase-like cupin family protein
VSTYDDASTLPRQQIWDGVVSRSIRGELVTLALLELAANAVVPEHSHENEQLGVLIQGSMTFTIGGESRTVGPGATWRILANVPHSVVVGPQAAVVAEAFAPARADWAAIDELPPSPPSWP